MNTLLVVCAGNTCRSPLALAALDTALVGHGFRARIALRSRGAHADLGRPRCDQMLRLAHRHGLRTRLVDEHLTRPLEPEDLMSADLVLTADRQVRATAVKLDPKAATRTFTLREAVLLARVATDADELPHDLVGFAAALNDSRGLTDLPSLERPLVRPWHRLRLHAHDVPDAHLDPRVSHRMVYRTHVPAAEELVARLTAFAAVRQW